jgi:hypothetical protein
MLLGGLVAAPVAAWAIRFVPARPMGIAVAGLLLITNARELASFGGIANGPFIWAIYSLIVAVVAFAFFAPRAIAASAPAPAASSPNAP